MYIRALLQVEPLEGYYVLIMQQSMKNKHREDVLEEVIASRMQSISDFLMKIRYSSVGYE
jgi:hypothetical protein